MPQPNETANSYWFANGACPVENMRVSMERVSSISPTFTKAEPNQTMPRRFGCCPFAGWAGSSARSPSMAPSVPASTLARCLAGAAARAWWAEKNATT